MIGSVFLVIHHRLAVVDRKKKVIIFVNFEWLITRSMMALATRIGLVTFGTHTTEPASRLVPSMMEASISTVPSSVRQDPRPESSARRYCI